MASTPTDGRRPVNLPGFQSPAVGFEAPFEMLSACHERVERMLALLARLQEHLIVRGNDASAQQAARDVMRYFDQAAPRHHEDEELHVFPPLLQSADSGLVALVRQLQRDHRRMEAAWAQAREVLASVAEGLFGGGLPPPQADVLQAFALLYRQHLLDEEGVVYPAAQAVLGPEALEAMSADMMARRGVRLGG